MTMKGPFLANPRGLGYTEKPAMKQRHRAAIVLLVALLSFAFALEGSLPGHTHENGRLGLYNAECPLAVLAAVHTAGALPTAPASAGIVLIGLGTIFAASRDIANPLPSSASPRAPPLA